jgi:hypothetical protein
LASVPRASDGFVEQAFETESSGLIELDAEVVSDEDG